VLLLSWSVDTLADLLRVAGMTITTSWDLGASLMVTRATYTGYATLTIVGTAVICWALCYLPMHGGAHTLLGQLSGFLLIICLLTMSKELIATFLMWEYLGIVSYMLIGFHSSKLVAPFKAVTYNKLGDTAFLAMLGMTSATLLHDGPLHGTMLLAMTDHVQQRTSFMGWTPSLLGLLMAVTCLSKSPLLPMTRWLLHAMAGPTPVSALLHSSTVQPV